MTLLMITPVLVHVLAACGYAVFGWRPATAWLGAVASAGTLASAIGIAEATTGQARTALGGLLRADALSAFMLIVIGAVALLAMLASPAHLAAEPATGSTAGPATRPAAGPESVLATRRRGAADIGRSVAPAVLPGIPMAPGREARTVTGQAFGLVTLERDGLVTLERDGAGARWGAARRYGVLTQAFVAAMALAVLAASLGVLWVAVEATTILTAFLVGHRRTRQAVEAAWKYVVICSVGIALALLGIVLTHYAAVHARIPSAGVLDWAVLTRAADGLDPGVMRIAVALLVLGFGTKAGLAPMHAWLPDAHGQAPAPVSALMSGVLLSVAFYAVLRVKVIADVALGIGFTRTLLITAALASLAVAAALLLAQRDYKRMLAYSSIEHMGLVALGAAVGSRPAMVAVLLHVLGHGLGKSVLFLSAGHVHQAFRSSKIAAVDGLAARNPLLAGVFGLGLLALLGLPPFSLFASELGIVRAGFASGLGWAVAASLPLTVVIGAAVLSAARRMLLGAPVAAEPPPPAPHRLGPAAAVPLVAGLLGCAVLGLTTGPLGPLLEAAATMAGATP
ncbi:proton-conducting transporter membrane subunit [Sphaerisporangium dianthi]|uniref:Proton-conducting transporter membrane subunit n=1 Tax=Sphaerisporangium dianthi TaxID=1436120 RepID=A0ABV9CI74_9ACTN